MDNKIISTINELKDFKKSVVWHDIQREIISWLDQVHIHLEDNVIGSDKLPSGYTDKELHRFGGNAETLRKVFNIIDVMITNLEQEEEITKEK